MLGRGSAYKKLCTLRGECLKYMMQKISLIFKEQRVLYLTQN